MLHICPFGKSIICYSSDEGKTFTPPHSIGLDYKEDAPAHFIEQNGVLISVYGHRERGNNSIRTIFSYDEGETWSKPHIITQLPEYHCDLGYPSSVVLKEGSILTIYYGMAEEYTEMTYTVYPEQVFEYAVPVVRQAIWSNMSEIV